VSVTLPHIDGHGATNYKGNAKPLPANTKECVLIIDHETGELTLERISNQIMLKKTRAEKAEKSSYLDKVYPTTQDNSNGLVLPSNPYQVKPEPHKLVKKEPENPYEVKKEPENPYEVKKEPNNPYEVKKPPGKPRTSNSARPATPQSRIKKNSPSAPYSSSSSSLPGLFKESLEAEHSNHSNHTISPLHSNKSSPARPSPNTQQQGYHIDSLGRVIAESSDDSDSGSSSGSDSDSDSEAAPDAGCLLEAAMAAAEAAPPPSFSLPGDLSDFLMPGTAPSLPPGQGHLPTARPHKAHKSDRREKESHSSPSSKQKTKQPPPAAAAAPPPPLPPPPPRQEEAGSMPSFLGDLGDDLQLSDSD